jgi:deoxyribodipyrimidine photo-lyase
MSDKPSMTPLRREFASRDELSTYLKDKFPEAAQVSAHTSPIRGGRRAAMERLGRVDPPEYAASRNYLNGRVSRLSPYLRHGAVSLSEVRDAALKRVRRRFKAEKFVNELAWRDYWQRLYVKLGDGIWRDQEPYKTGWQASDYADDLPDDIANAKTGTACMDGFARELHEIGYLHNHARMWLAAYVVHWRRVKWQAGARWFLSHLLDGDPASNNLSWQWVASTFSHKPYIFNRANLEKFTAGFYCRECPLAHRRQCPFESSYEQLSAELFPHAPQENAPPRRGGR